MIQFTDKTLPNGLRVLIHEDESTQLAAVNLVYNVGARDEEQDKTGFAHLFEHLMFGGSEHIPDYDAIAQAMGAENNAFTNNDITNYYLSFPAYNLESALWLESDRMKALTLNSRSLEVQRSVVIEEFKQRYLNQPYGNVWHLLRELCYKEHPYQWPTIGKNIKHIEDATLEDVQHFFDTYYRPNNAVLTVAGNVKTYQVLNLVERWFSDIEPGEPVVKSFPKESEQTRARTHYHYAEVPADMIVMAWHVPPRVHQGYYVADLLSDLLGRGKSARLTQALVKEQAIFSNIHAYVTGDIDTGLLVIQGTLLPEINMGFAEQAIHQELKKLQDELITEKELNKIRNQLEAQKVFGETSVLNIAMNLGFAALLGNPQLVNTEIQYYQAITPQDLQLAAKRILASHRTNTLYYFSKSKNA